MLSSYPSIYNVGHKAVLDIFNSPVIVEEKIDGSQFGFGIHPETLELMIRSKGCVMVTDAPEKMFNKAAETVKGLYDKLTPGWIYRGEFLGKPKHNTLPYARTPEKYIIIFDISTGPECYLSPEDKAAEAARIGLECVPVLYRGMVGNVQEFRALLENESCLGGPKIEGVVIKPEGYNLFGPDKKVLLAKFVSEAFKESHTHAWKESNPGHGDIIELIAHGLVTEARWHKAVQHLRDAGTLDGSPRDIGPLMLEVQADTEKECAGEIKDALFAWAWPQIRRKVSHGLPEWWKNELVKLAFEE